MQKWVSRFAALIGIIALIWAVSAVLHFGATNMRRVEESASHWRTTGEFR